MWAQGSRSSARAIRRAALLGSIACAAATTIAVVGLPSAQAQVFTPLTLPTIGGSAVEGSVLTETHANWSEQPAGYTLQWQRCNAEGERCQSIPKATAKTYRLTSEDVGSTIRVSENARNAAGAVTPDLSEPTAVVRSQKSGGGGGGGSAQGGGGNTQGGGNNSHPGSGTPTHPSSAELVRLLARQLAPSGRAASIGALRRHGGLSMRFEMPAAGVVTMKWYVVAQAPRRNAKRKRGPLLLATGHATLAAGRTTTVTIRLTAGGRRLLRRSHALHLQARATFAVSGGATVTAAKTFSLTR